MRWIQAAVVMLAIALGSFAIRSCAADDTEDLVLVGTVVNVVDGDTVDVELDSGKIRVRVWGVDTPEPDQPLSDGASALLHELVDGREVEVRPAEQTSFDRMVARVFAGDTDVNAEIVKRGLGMAERRYLGAFEDGETYCELEHAARSARVGIWALPPEQRIAPWEWRHRKERKKPFSDYTNETIEHCVALIGKPLDEQGALTALDPPKDPKCGAKSTCKVMDDCAEATFYLEQCGLTGLDRDGDGVPCEARCQ